MKYYWFLAISLITVLSCREHTKPHITLPQIIHIEKFPSKVISQRNIDIWLPPNYTKGAKRYPVLYMHDGQMLFNPKDCWNGQAWEVDSIANRLIEKELIEPIIIVGIWSTDKRYQEYCPQDPIINNPETMALQSDIILGDPLSNDYLEFIVTELKPFIDKKYHTQSTLKNTAIMGSSMGGLISLYALCKYPEVFYKAGCMSTHWPGPNKDFMEITSQAYISYFSQNIPLANSEHKIYFDYGTETLDSLYPPYQALMDKEMVINNYNTNENWVTNRYEGHGHSEAFWRKRLADPLIFLFGK